ncbi:MAG TPA: patatin-like phospholipase family protein, partial [Anaerolineales bacterium]|nr:patatin-like phospholipase family protein [Anaerolineales bacterium]
MIKYPFKNLVFQGGGVKTLTYHGALQVLEEMDVLPQIERVAGTSAGATVALLVSLRLGAEEIVRLLRSVDYAKIPGTHATQLPEWARVLPLPEDQVAWVMQRMDTLSREPISATIERKV